MSDQEIEAMLDQLRQIAYIALAAAEERCRSFLDVGDSAP
jgi:hypothetical protein